MYLVTTVDDLGLHIAVRRSVKSLAHAGRITSASLLTNGPDAEESLKIEDIGIGVQLNVLRGRPLSPQAGVSSLLGHDGRFLRDYGELFRRFLSGKIILSQIESEWAAQIQWMIDHGVKPTHLTSERSMHAWPGLMGVAGKLAEQYGVGWVRRPQQCEAVLKDDSGRMRKEFMNICSMLQRQPEPVESPDLVWGQDQEQGDGQPESLLRDLRGSSYEVVEVVFRPGNWQEGDEAVTGGFEPGPTQVEWGTALATLEGRNWGLALEELGVNRVDFRAIDRSGK
ncbi:MAG: ChbG/HpnK family deacetylase [Proteobacteria bacterium]|nr:ChbG/HpnK family deacetylase [Pseudomonadota bacterium]MBU1612032.1 ChbG/HpnK family deacetylase [Pseudomonadota bacterium]